MLNYKVMLASDWDASKLSYPVWVMPKIDGVRGVNFDGTLRGRSLKKFANLHTSEKFSKPQFQGLDCELVAAGLTDSDLCRKTTSALTTIQGEPSIGLCVFDLVTPATERLPYKDRYLLLQQFLTHMSQSDRMWCYLVPYFVANNLEDVLRFEEQFLELGYEGIIIRDPNKPYKRGRSTAKECGLLRGKRFIDSEMLVRGLVEGETNLNEAQVNENGLQFRSSHQENKVLNGTVGNLQGELLEDVFDGVNPEPILKQGATITVSPGNMTAEQRKYYWENPSAIVDKVIKFKFFPKGIKDKPRFPTYVCHRDPVDMGS